MNRTHSDKILLRRRALLKKVHNISAYFFTREGYRITGDRILQAAAQHDADRLALELFTKEVEILGLTVTEAEVVDAIAYYGSLTRNDLHDCYRHARDNGYEHAQSGFDYWIVNEYVESRFCRLHDC